MPNEHCQLLRLCSERRYSDRGEGGTGGEEIVRLCRAASGQREAASEDDSVHNTPPIIQQPGTVANENRLGLELGGWWQMMGSSRKGRGLSRSRDTHVFDNRRTERGGHLGRFTAMCALRRAAISASCSRVLERMESFLRFLERLRAESGTVS